jgi:hypothetical protein
MSCPHKERTKKNTKIIIRKGEKEEIKRGKKVRKK